MVPHEPDVAALANALKLAGTLYGLPSTLLALTTPSSIFVIMAIVGIILIAAGIGCPYMESLLKSVFLNLSRPPP